jgi:hypothetical protein
MSALRTYQPELLRGDDEAKTLDRQCGGIRHRTDGNALSTSTDLVSSGIGGSRRTI